MFANSNPWIVKSLDYVAQTGKTERTRSRDAVRAAYGSLPLSFEPNHGQADPGFDFLSRARIVHNSSTLTIFESAVVWELDDHRDGVTTMKIIKISVQRFTLNVGSYTKPINRLV